MLRANGEGGEGGRGGGGGPHAHTQAVTGHWAAPGTTRHAHAAARPGGSRPAAPCRGAHRDKLPLPREWTGGGQTFLLKVQGDSMRDARIFDGDLVLVKVQPQALPGEIVVAMVDDEVTVKRFQMDGKAVVLTPENEAFAPIRIGEGTRFRILGKVSAVFRKV